MIRKMSLGLVLFSMSLAQAGTKKMYEVTIKNITSGQPLTPVVLAVHSPHKSLINVGYQASKGLSLLAKDGMTDELVKELTYAKGVVRTKVGSGIILPGKSESITIEANNPYFKLSLVSMLARTNDAIAVLSESSLKLKVGQGYKAYASVYDAGVELNTESCSDIPAPPCNSPGVGQSEDSFIRPHAGIHLQGDLDANRDKFASKVALVTIKRIQ